MSRLEIALDNLIDNLNSLTSHETSELLIIRQFSRTHRTLQQAFVAHVIIPILKQLADDYAEGRTDARNAKSGQLAVKMLHAVTDEDLYLPFV